MIEQLKHPEIRRRITAARTALILDEPFFGTLALKLKLVEDVGCPTAWTNGHELGYSPAFFQTMNQKQITTVLVHEVMHCAAGHPWRRDSRDPRKWNEAADRAINPVLREAKYEFPDGALFELDDTHKGKSAEWIYDRLPREQQKNKQQSTGGDCGSGAAQQGQSTAPQQGSKGQKNDPAQAPLKGPAKGPGLPQDDEKGGTAPTGHPPNPLGEVRDAPTEGTDVEDPVPTEADWQQAVQQAAVLAKGQGNMPASLKRFAKVAATSRIDWRAALRRFVQEVAKADYSFARPNPRYVTSGFYLPVLRSHEVGVLAIGVDTSGSVDQVLLNQFASEIQAIADEVKPRQIRALYCDAKVQHEDVFERDDVIALHMHGGGGTDFRPVFNAIAKWDEPPVAVVYLTDLMGTFPEEEPNVPTLWVTGEAEARPVPFGEVVAAEGR